MKLVHLILAPAGLAALLAACASKPPAPTQPLTPYTCNGTYTSLLLDYSNIDATRATLHLMDKTYSLQASVAASGVRYTNGRTDAFPRTGTLIWWTKGPEGILYEVAKRADGNTYEKQLANCTSIPQPLATPVTPAATLPVPTPLPGTIPGTVPGVLNTPQQPQQQPQPIVTL